MLARSGSIPSAVSENSTAPETFRRPNVSKFPALPPSSRKGAGARLTGELLRRSSACLSTHPHPGCSLTETLGEISFVELVATAVAPAAPLPNRCSLVPRRWGKPTAERDQFVTRFGPIMKKGGSHIPALHTCGRYLVFE